jgi:hypothetical protein
MRVLITASLVRIVPSNARRSLCLLSVAMVRSRPERNATKGLITASPTQTVQPTARRFLNIFVAMETSTLTKNAIRVNSTELPVPLVQRTALSSHHRSSAAMGRWSLIWARNATTAVTTAPLARSATRLAIGFLNLLAAVMERSKSGKNATRAKTTASPARSAPPTANWSMTRAQVNAKPVTRIHSTTSVMAPLLAHLPPTARPIAHAGQVIAPTVWIRQIRGNSGSRSLDRSTAYSLLQALNATPFAQRHSPVQKAAKRYRSGHVNDSRELQESLALYMCCEKRRCKLN